MITHFSKDLNWRQMNSIFFGRWTRSTGSTCSTCSEWGSACWLCYLLHLKFFMHGVTREREKGREREIGRERDRERERKIKRQKEKERERERKRNRNRKRGIGREREGCFCKRLFFLLLAPGSPQGKNAVILNLGNKPTQVNWSLSWSSVLDICGKNVLS